MFAKCLAWNIINKINRRLFYLISLYLGDFTDKKIQVSVKELYIDKSDICGFEPLIPTILQT